jgi:hypothetical protein
MNLDKKIRMLENNIMKFISLFYQMNLLKTKMNKIQIIVIYQQLNQLKQNSYQQNYLKNLLSQHNPLPINKLTLKFKKMIF